MAVTIEDLLNSLSNPENLNNTGKLENTKDTWKRIGNKDDFPELGLEPTELESFLAEWIADNPYNNI